MTQRKVKVDGGYKLGYYQQKCKWISVDPWTTQVWTPQVHLYTDFFPVVNIGFPKKFVRLMITLFNKFLGENEIRLLFLLKIKQTFWPIQYFSNKRSVVGWIKACGTLNTEELHIWMNHGGTHYKLYINFQPFQPHRRLVPLTAAMLKGQLETK